MDRFRKISLAVIIMICSVLIICTSGCGAVYVNADTITAVVINELVSSNTLSLNDPYVGTPDWIEFYNTSSSRVDISGFGLTDNLKAPHKWTFPDGTVLGPGEYMLVYCVKDPGGLPKNVYCTDFALSKNGETLFFTDKYYNVLQEVHIPALLKDISYARTAEGSFGYCASPTPGALNSDAVVKNIKDIKYAVEDGILTISEVMPNNAGVFPAADGEFYDWAEIHNSSSRPVDLHDYWLSDDSMNFSKWRMPELTLEAGGYAVIYFSGIDSKGSEIHASFRLGPDDDVLYLSDKQTTVRSEIHWDSELPGNVSVVQTEQGSAYTAFSTPGSINSNDVFYTAKYSDMDSSDPVRISEVLPDNLYSIMDSDGDRPGWVELYNSSEDRVSLSGYYLSDDPENRIKWALPDITLNGGEFFIVFLSGKNRTGPEFHASFRLGKSDGTILLTNLNGLKTDRLDFGTETGENISAGRSPGGNICYYGQPTPGAQNSTAAFDLPGLVQSIDPNGVYISEVCSVSAAKSDETDWIELYNGGSGPIDLTGWFLSDDIDEPRKFKINGVEIPGNGYALIAADENNKETTGVKAPFGISQSGERLILSNADGFAVDMFDTGVQRAGTTSGRMENDPVGTRVFFAKATPKAANAPGFSSYASSPVFSANSLYNTEAFELSITCATEGASIFYTLDGSVPTVHSDPYTSPIRIDKNTPVRAIAVRDGLLPSEITTHTFLFEEKHSVPVVCITGNPGDINKVYSVTDRWQKIEREGFAEYYEADGKLGIIFPCGLRVSGASTLLDPQKSLTLYLRSGYGRAEITYPFFKDSDVNTFKSLVIRAGGQDRQFARLRDSFFSKAVKGMNIDFAETRLCVVYINGKYWGIYDLNENQNEDYLSGHYGVNPEEVDIIRRNITPLEGTREDIKRVRAYALNKDLSNDETYAKFLEWVDADAFIDYVAAQTYFANSDMFNQKYWRSWDYSVKWRPVFFDLDFGLHGNNPSRNILGSYFKVEGVPSRDGSLTNMDIFCGLKKNKGWRDRFVERYVWLIYNQFDPERLTAILRGMAEEMRPEMKRHIERWGAPSSVSKWENEIEDLRRVLEKRPSYALKDLQTYFGVSDESMQYYIDKAKQG